MRPGGVGSGMHSLVLQSGGIGSPPAILLGLALLAAILLVGRVVLAVAWRLVIIALLIAAALWVLGLVGLGTGLL
jgi:hypothetical protein